MGLKEHESTTRGPSRVKDGSETEHPRFRVANRVGAARRLGWDNKLELGHVSPSRPMIELEMEFKS